MNMIFVDCLHGKWIFIKHFHVICIKDWMSLDSFNFYVLFCLHLPFTLLRVMWRKSKKWSYRISAVTLFYLFSIYFFLFVRHAYIMHFIYCSPFVVDGAKSALVQAKCSVKSVNLKINFKCIVCSFRGNIFCACSFDDYVTVAARLLHFGGGMHRLRAQMQIIVRGDVGAGAICSLLRGSHR